MLIREAKWNITHGVYSQKILYHSFKYLPGWCMSNQNSQPFKAMNYFKMNNDYPNTYGKY